MRRTLCSLVLLSALFGCARVENASVVHADGSVERTVVVKINNVASEMSEGQQKVMPRSFITLSPNASWKTEESVSPQGEDLITATMKLAPGQVVADEFIISDGEDAKANCSVAAKKLPDGNVEYTETWTWKGKLDVGESPIAGLDALIVAKLEAKGVAKQEGEKVARSVLREAWRMIFGPGDPILATMLTNTELAMRRLNNGIAKKVVSELSTAAPAMSGEERLAIAAEIVREMHMSKMADPEANAPTPDEDGRQNLLVSILSRVKGPGVVVETDGEQDILAGETFWSMYLEACAHEPVVLKAVFKP